MPATATSSTVAGIETVVRGVGSLLPRRNGKSGVTTWRRELVSTAPRMGSSPLRHSIPIAVPLAVIGSTPATLLTSPVGGESLITYDRYLSCVLYSSMALA